MKYDHIKERVNMGKRLLIIIAAISLVFVLASCKEKNEEIISPPETNNPTATPVSPQPTPTPPTPEPTPTLPEPPPKAPEITIPPGLRDELKNLWKRIDGSTATIPLTTALYDAIQQGTKPPDHNTTPNAYLRLMEKEYTDLIFVTYPSENELRMARENRVELEIIPVTKDALVFLVNAENPVDNIRISQLRDVYTSKISNWKSLGGINESIIPYQRTADSGSQTLLLKLVMDGLPPMDPPSVWIAEAMGALVESVSNYDNSRSALGYSMFYYVNNMYGNSRFKLLGIDGVIPTRETITQGQYPLEDCYYAVMRKDTPADSPARTLVNWLLTDDGQMLAIQAGYIPLRPIEGAFPDNTIDPIYRGDTDNSSGTGGTALKSGIEDIQPVNGVRPPLSDLFFNGFNYIQYINSEIISSLNDVDFEAWYKLPLEEQHLKRPFTGIPNNYPNYVIYGKGDLFVELPEGNPFFNRGINFYIRLTEDISPYGLGLPEYSLTYDYDRRLLPNVDLYTLKVNIPDKPGVSARINERLKVWTDTFPGSDESVSLLKSFCNWFNSSASNPYRLQPIGAKWQDYLSISYILQTYDGPSIDMPMVYTICFDMKTGNTVDLTKVLPGKLDYSRTHGITPADFSDTGEYGYPRQENTPDGYVPAAGSVITDAWIMYGINILVTEPNGRVLQFLFWEDAE